MPLGLMLGEEVVLAHGEQEQPHWGRSCPLLAEQNHASVQEGF